MRLYVAGPRTGVPEYNREAFNRTAKVLRDMRHAVISPVDLDDPEDGMLAGGDGSPLPEKVYTRGLEKCIAAMTGAAVDGVCVLDGWEESRGATLEVHVARELGKPVYRLKHMFEMGLGHAHVLEIVNGVLADVRKFDSGATRDTDEGKPDYEGYLSPAVMRAFGAYMLRHSVQSDGSHRASDNWQKGIPTDAYMKSAWRHFMDWWEQHRASDLDFDADALEEALCALLFNVQGYLHETLSAS